ncbi:MAG: Patatin [Fluviicola sp.]|nr:MAG: Patatin [Fluviicola sp.]
MKTKYALVLSGGGFLAAFQLGALNYLSENWKKITGLDTPMKFDLISSISGGSMNGSLLAMNKLDLLNDLWVHQIGRNGASEIYTSEFIDTSSKSDHLKFKLDLKQLSSRLNVKLDFELGVFEKLGVIFSKKKRANIIKSVLKELQSQIKVSLPKFKSIADNTPLKKKLQKYLDRSLIKGTKFFCGFVSLDSGKYHSVSHDEFSTDNDFVNGVLSSASIPMIWNPVEKISFRDGLKTVVSTNNIDGGVRNVSPLGDLIKHINQDKKHRYKIIVINCSHPTPKHKDYSNKSIGTIAYRSLYEIAMNEIFNNDVNHFIKINDLIKQAESNGHSLTEINGTQLRSFDATIINPDQHIDLGSPLVVNEKLIKQRMDHGELMATQVFTNPKI